MNFAVHCSLDPSFSNTFLSLLNLAAIYCIIISIPLSLCKGISPMFANKNCKYQYIINHHHWLSFRNFEVRNPRLYR
jgi:hypothetical protein